MDKIEFQQLNATILSGLLASGKYNLSTSRQEDDVISKAFHLTQRLIGYSEKQLQS
jgi:hypothetical protein